MNADDINAAHERAHARAVEVYGALPREDAPPAGVVDCGEAGHAEGRCGNAACLRGSASALGWRWSEIERDRFVLKVHWKPILAPLFVSRLDPPEEDEIQIDACELWVKTSIAPPHPLGVGHQRVKVCDLLTLDFVEEFDLWDKLYDELWRIYGG